MADLKCAVDNCTYNDQHLCCKGDIMVGGQQACSCDDTCCESFRQQKVKCVYNSNYKCHADHVDIKGCGACDCRGTVCSTFKER